MEWDYDVPSEVGPDGISTARSSLAKWDFNEYGVAISDKGRREALEMCQKAIEMFAAEWETFLFVLLAIVIVIIYWLQNNALLGNLKKTDGIHTTISIFQIFFVLLFLYSIGSGVRIGDGIDSRAFESVAAMMVGLMSLLGWYYAMHKGDLLDPDLDAEEAIHILQKNKAEPITAAITIPFAFIDPLAWELSWFLYPFIKYLYARLKK